MPSITLPAPIVSCLAKIPEDGQGYQIVDITFEDSSVAERVTVLNCTVADIPAKFVGKTIFCVNRSNK